MHVNGPRHSGAGHVTAGGLSRWLSATQKSRIVTKPPLNGDTQT